MQCGKGGQIVATNFPMSASSFSDMIPSALGYIGIPSPGYSGKSARIGGMSIAADAGVPEYLIWMQSGHKQLQKPDSARGYITLTNTSLLYGAFNGFWTLILLSSILWPSGPEMDGVFMSYFSFCSDLLLIIQFRC